MAKSGRQAGDVSREQGRFANILCAGQSRDQSFRSDRETAFRGHTVLERLKEADKGTGIDASLGHDADRLVVIVDSLSSRHKLRSSKEQVEGLAKLGIGGVRVCVKRALRGRVVCDE